jgi:type IV pilus assembly protein PilQ
MNEHKRFNKIVFYGAFYILLLLISFGCGENKNVKKDPFFKEWTVKAEKSQAYSPAATRHQTDLTEKTAKAVVIEDKALPEQKPEVRTENLLPTTKISLKMHDIDLSVLLRAMARAADQNIMINEKVQGKANINITQAPWDQVFLGVLKTHGLTYSWEGNIIRIMTVEDMEQDLKRASQQKDFRMVAPLQTRVIAVNYSEAPKLRENLEKFLVKDQEGKPLGSVMVDEHTNSLIIQAISEDMEEIVALIDKLDRPTPQVLIEAHIVEATKTTAMELGVQWGGLSKNGLWITPGSSGTVGGSSGVLGGTVGTAIDPTSGFASNFPAGGVTNALGMTIGFAIQDVGSSLISAQLSALEQEGKLNILSSPSITTLDNQKALIESGSEIPYQTVEDGEVKIEFKKAVLSLEVIPHVINGKTLKLQIKTKKDEVDETRSISGNPALITKLAETNVLLFDGQTTVIGGLTKEKRLKTESGVPFLKDVPLLGWLFKTDTDEEEMEDLLIFITPHILKEKYEDNAQGVPAEGKPPENSASKPEAAAQ